ncbi:MAG: hypothetical protein AAF531_16355, partial [Actinomycetota bacterium]
MLLRSEVAGTAGRIGGHCVTASDHNDRDGVPGSGGHWFEAVADHLGPAYLKYSFTRGTAAEVDGV